MTINRRIVTSVLSIGAAGALLVGATFAFFNDSDVSNGNTFNSGTFEVEVNDNGVSPDFALTIGNITGLAPGDITNQATVKVVNKGSINAATFGRLTLSGASTPDLSEELSIYNYKVEYFDNAACTVPTPRWGPLVTDTDPYFGTDNNEDWFIKDGNNTLWNGVGGTENLKSWVTGNGPLDVPGTAWDIEALKQNECYVLTLQFKMDDNATEAYAGTSVTVGYEVKSTQVNETAIEALGLAGISDASSIIGYLQSQVTP